MAHFKSHDIYKRYVEIISEKMDWNDEFFIHLASDGWYTWPDKTEKDVAEVKEKTGIQCRISSEGVLVVPMYDNFKSEKQKKMLDDLGQYGVTMFNLDLGKKLTHKDLKEAYKIVSRELHARCSEEDFRKIITQIIDKIS